MNLEDLLKEPFQFPSRDEVDALVREAMKYLPSTRKDLSSRVSHSIRTPLAAILGFQEVIELDAQVSEADRAMYREIVASETHRLKRFIETLRVFQALLAGGLQIDRTRMDLRQTVDGAVDRCSYEGKAKEVRIETIRSGNEIPFLADHRYLALAIEHLILNALRATPSGGIVDSEIIESDKTVSIIVEDSGYGMEPSQIETMFKPFQRIPRPDDNGGELGLGLSVVRSIVERHEGLVRTESSPMNGARFTLTFPR